MGFYDRILAELDIPRLTALVSEYGVHVGAAAALAFASIMLASIVSQQRRGRVDVGMVDLTRAELAALERAEREAEQAEADRPYMVARGIARDQAGHYLFSSPMLTDLARRCPFVDQRALAALLRIAAQEALTADGVPPLIVPLRAEDTQRLMLAHKAA